MFRKCFSLRPCVAVMTEVRVVWWQRSELALEYYVTAVDLVSAATTALKGEHTHYDCVQKDLVEWHGRSEVYIIHCKFNNKI